MFEAPRNWQDVTKLSTKGFVELNNRKQIICGPFNNIALKPDDTRFHKHYSGIIFYLEWAAKRTVHLGRPVGDWEILSHVPCEAVTSKVPTPTVPLILEETAYGKRIRWGINFIYLERSDILNPKDVKGFVFPERAKELQVL
jgi:hypothetical protein